LRYPSKMQKELNDWSREHLDPMFKPHWGVIKLSKGNTYEHNLRVCEVALTLLEHDIPFCTEARLKCGTRPDIVAPTHVLPYIEVLFSETKDDFFAKKAGKLPDSLQRSWIFVDAKKPYHEEMIF